MTKKHPDSVDIEVGRRIRARRLESGMSQTELGRRIGVTFQQVQKYEKGANRVGAGRLTQIAKVLDLPVSTLFGTPKTSLSNEPDVSGPESEYLAAPGAFRLLRAYGRLPQSMLRRAVIDLVERLVAVKKPRTSRRP